MSRPETYDLIKKYEPMIPPQLLKKFEDKEGDLKYDVMLIQSDGENTYLDMLPSSFQNVTLRSLANNIYDQLSFGYELWVREPAPISEERGNLTQKYMRYAMSLTADNMEEDGDGLDFRIVSGWLVITEDKTAENGSKESQKFYDQFCIYKQNDEDNPGNDDDWYEKTEIAYKKTIQERVNKAESLLF